MNIRLVIFDVEGVLIPKRRFLFTQILKWLKIHEIMLTLIYGFLYEIGLVSLEFAIRKIYGFFRNLSVSEFSQTFREIQLIPGALELFEALRVKGYKTAVISSGLPIIFLEHIAKRLGSDYAFGLELEKEKEYLTGNIRGNVIEPEGKAIVLRKFLQEKGFVNEDCIVVGDDRNNLPMLPLCSRSIGFNPDFLFTVRCNYVIKGNLLDILPFLESTPRKRDPSNFSTAEIFRKTIHIGSFLIPFLIKFFNINIWYMGSLLILVMFLYIISEFLRQKGMEFPIFSLITSKAVVSSENWGFATAPIFFALGVLLPLLIFPIPIGFVSITVLTLGDGFAAIFGKKFGHISNPLDKSKRLEGTFIGFFFAFLGTLFFIDPISGLVASLVGMFIEAIPLPIDDNLSIPIFSGLVISGMVC